MFAPALYHQVENCHISNKQPVCRTFCCVCSVFFLFGRTILGNGLLHRSEHQKTGGQLSFQQNYAAIQRIEQMTNEFVCGNRK